MAPREASGTFPDQYLTYDFEPSVPLGGGGPPAHEGFPGVTAAANVEDAMPPGTADNNNNISGAENEAAAAGNSHGGGTTATGRGTNQQHGGGVVVDPLSIDPTAAAALMSPQLPDLSMSSIRTLRNTQTASSLMRPAVPPPMRRRVVSPQTSVSSSLGGNMSTTTTTPGLTSTDSTSSMMSSHTHEEEEEEYDEEEEVPGLDVTYGSLSLTTGVNNSGGSSQPQEQQQLVLSTSHSMAQEDSWENHPHHHASHMVEDDVSLAASGGQASSSAPASPAFVTAPPLNHAPAPSPTSPNSILLSFGPNTTVSDLKYFAERGCIVALLQALNTPRLVTLGTRMLADYAKMSHRRVAVASNRRILAFVQQTMLMEHEVSQDWLGREYAVETVRSLTATEESDKYLMRAPGLLNTLALVAKGGPFATDDVSSPLALASEKARLHACIAIMNLSCGKANKIEIAKLPNVLEAMRDVMLHSNEEARLKATTCIKNLSNADANDAALLATRGLVQALGKVATMTCTMEGGATPCTTNACLALMNLSISKANKHRVFRTPGVMEALMAVLERTTAQGSSTEARIKACSALSNLAIGYDNKIPMFHYPGFVDAILNVIQTDTGEARTKACSILWSFAAEMKNQVPVVQRGDILPVLVQVADEDGTTEARFKCVAALTLLAESLENAIPLLQSGALEPLMDILHQAGPDPTQWKGQTASWCVGFLMNIAQSDEAVPTLREAGVVELLAPLLTLDHYQSLKAAMAVTFVCRYDEGDECYDLLRKTENAIPKIISLLHNTLSGRGGNGYKYGVFTLRSSVGCIAALASGPDFMKERIATGPVFESLLRVLSDFCVDGGTPGAIVGGGRDDVLSATLAIRATQSLTAHLIPTTTGCSALPFGQSMEERLLLALKSFETAPNQDLPSQTRALATDAKVRIEGGRKANNRSAVSRFVNMGSSDGDVDMNEVALLASNCCGLQGLPGFGESILGALALPNSRSKKVEIISNSSMVEDDANEDSSSQTHEPVRTFLLADARTGRRFAVPTDPSGGRAFNDNRVWCYRRGRFCLPGEQPDPNFVWTEQLQEAYEAALSKVQGDDEQEEDDTSSAATSIQNDLGATTVSADAMN